MNSIPNTRSDDETATANVADLAAIAGRATLTPTADGVLLESDAAPWSYVAQLETAHWPSFDGPVAVRIELHVAEGDVGVGILTQQDWSDYIIEETVGAAPDDQTIDLRVAAAADMGSLIFRSGKTPGRPRTTIKSIRLTADTVPAGQHADPAPAPASRADDPKPSAFGRTMSMLRRS